MSLNPVILDIAATLGVPAARQSDLRIEGGGSGGNNRIYFVTLDGRKVVAKQYFRHPSDERDRLQAERAFLEYAAKAGIGCVPRVVAGNSERGLGIYEYIAGRKIEIAELSAARVREAATFFLRLNDPACREAAKALPVASEACFSIERHLEMVDRRIRQLEVIPGVGDVERAARDFVEVLAGRWREIKTDILQAARTSWRDPAAEVEERCVSPSDFGFHNALVRESGDLCFLDFEYAGRDDPAKMVGDFFAHPGMPVSREYFDEFVRTTMSFSRHAPALEARARLLVPLFQVKWCCIILNDFIPEAAQRRRFADPGLDETLRKQGQLEKAHRMLASV